jgi:hypothetical protein
MATTYTLISSVTVGSGGAANIEFTSIPSTYTDLCLTVSGRMDTTTVWGVMLAYFNNDTTNANYYYRMLEGDGSAVASDNGATPKAGVVNGGTTTANTFGNLQLYIPNYAGSNKKSFSVDSVNENNATTAFTNFQALIWNNTSAITSIKIQPEAGGKVFTQYSTAYLYGISNA